MFELEKAHQAGNNGLRMGAKTRIAADRFNTVGKTVGVAAIGKNRQKASSGQPGFPGWPTSVLSAPTTEVGQVYPNLPRCERWETG